MSTRPSAPIPAAKASLADEIIFYDLKCSTPGESWSPHCWKTRLALQYKRVPFRTIWVSYPDVKAVVGHTQPGAEAPTLPVIQHGTTWVADSWNIVQYLERLFPDPPLLLPSIESTHFFMCYVEGVLSPPVRPFLIPRVAAFLDDRGREYFVRTREAHFGQSLEEVGRGTTVEPIRQPLGPVARNLSEFGPYLGGKQISYMDLILLGFFEWLGRADRAAVDGILEMYKKPSGSYPIKDWYESVKHLAVAQPEPFVERP